MSCSSWICTAFELMSRQDRCGLDAYLRRCVPVADLERAAQGENLDHAKIACVCLGMVGEAGCQKALVHALQRGDATLANLAEHALWSVWFRSGPTAEANAALAAAVADMAANNLTPTLAALDRLIAQHPTFAEAFNQRAIARFLAEQYDGAIEDCLSALRLNSCHFGAMAGMGHCHAHRGRLPEALACYQAALAVHPGLDCIRSAAEQLQGVLDETKALEASKELQVKVAG